MSNDTENYCKKHPDSKKFYTDIFDITYCMECFSEENLFCEKHEKHLPCRSCLKENDDLEFEKAIQRLENESFDI